MKYLDSKYLNDVQRRKLCKMLHHALVEIRYLTGAGRSEQASDLADAFHNLPDDIWHEWFSLSHFRDAYLGAYYQKWPLVLAQDYRLLLSEVEDLG